MFRYLDTACYLLSCSNTSLDQASTTESREVSQRSQGNNFVRVADASGSLNSSLLLLCILRRRSLISVNLTIKSQQASGSNHHEFVIIPIIRRSCMQTSSYGPSSGACLGPQVVLIVPSRTPHGHFNETSTVSRSIHSFFPSYRIFPLPVTHASEELSSASR